jgi:hypothetical protein
MVLEVQIGIGLSLSGRPGVGLTWFASACADEEYGREEKELHDQ